MEMMVKLAAIDDAPESLELIEAARLTPIEVVARLASAKSGLTSQEAAARLRYFGPNAIRSHGAQPLAVLVRQLRNPLLILLAAATERIAS